MAKAKKTAKKAVAAKKKPAGKKAAKASKSGRPAAKKAAKKAAKPAAKKKPVTKAAKTASKKKAVKVAKTAVKKKATKKTTAASAKKSAAKRSVPKKTVVRRVAPRKPAPAPPAVKKKVKLSSSGSAFDAQQKIYAEGVDLLNARKYSQAVTRFKKALEGPDVGLRHSATVYLRICEQRMQSSAPEPKTVEDRYNAAIALINDRQLEDAERLLRLALKQEPKGAHLHYALAVSASLSGQGAEAMTNLERAIELDPQTRILALRDADLSSLRTSPAFVELLSDDSEGEAASE